jgi:hypothetical protein
MISSKRVEWIGIGDDIEDRAHLHQTHLMRAPALRGIRVSAFDIFGRVMT